MVSKTGVACGSNNNCTDLSGCPSGQCPDFTIKRNDTFPAFKVAVTDCDGPLDLTNESLSVTVSFWGKSKLKTAIDESDDIIAFADNIGFDQLMVGDIIIMDRVRDTEKMLVLSFNEADFTINVERGYDSTTSSSWPKGNKLRFFRAIDVDGALETVTEDVEQLDGTILSDQIIESYLIYEWTANDTSSPGCFWLQFKLTNADDNWVRRFPESSEGFLIKIYDSTV